MSPEPKPRRMRAYVRAQRQRILDMAADGASHASIAKTCVVSRQTVARVAGPKGTGGRHTITAAHRRKIVELMVAGVAMKAIGAKVGVSDNTVRKYWGLAVQADPTLRRTPAWDRSPGPRATPLETRQRIVDLTAQGMTRPAIAALLGIALCTVGDQMRRAYAADPSLPRKPKATPKFTEAERARQRREARNATRIAAAIAAPPVAPRPAAKPTEPPVLVKSKRQIEQEAIDAAIAAGKGVRFERIVADIGRRVEIQTGPQAMEYLRGLGFQVSARAKAGRITHYRVTGGSDLDARGWMLATPFVLSVRSIVFGTSYRKVPIAPQPQQQIGA